MALPRALRLRTNSEFQRVRQQGRSISSRLLIIAWMPNGSTEMHIGFVVGKRISKHAVLRNYIKRLLTEAIRPFLSELSSGLDVVISARSNIVGADLPKLVQDVGTLLRRAKLLKPAHVEHEQ